MINVYFDNNKIYFKDADRGVFAYTDYDEGLWKKISEVKTWSVNWSTNKDGVRKGYLYSSKYKMYLHQMVMEYWYGSEEFLETKRKNFVIDHINNNSFDCTLHNLCFIPKDLNTAKGQTYDKSRKEALPIIALNFFKDFQTGKFQITIGFNLPTSIVEDGITESITAVRLLYKNDFFVVFLDAQKILHEFIEYGEFDLEKLSCIQKDIEKTHFITLNEDEKNAVIVERDGKSLLVLGPGVLINTVAPKKEIYLQENQDEE